MGVENKSILEIYRSLFYVDLQKNQLKQQNDEIKSRMFVIVTKYNLYKFL